MITPDDPTLALWRLQRVNRHLSDDYLAGVILAAYRRVDSIATRQMTAGARDLAASYVVRMSRQHCDARQALHEIVHWLTGGEL